MAENVMAKIPQALYNFIDELESWHPEVFAKHKLTAKSMKADTALMENLYYRHRRFMETTNYDADYAIKLALASVCNIPITDWFTIDKEFEYLKQFTIEANDYDVNNTTRQQIRALWTAYCLHKNLEPDAQGLKYVYREIGSTGGPLRRSILDESFTSRDNPRQLC